MPKWKYQNPDKQRMYTDYKSGRLYFDDGKPTKLGITDWEFSTGGESSPSFKCFVVEENGEKVDKHWSVWDFDLKEALKAKLKGMNPRRDKAEITVTRRQKGMEEIYTLK